MYTLIIEDKNGVIADEFSFNHGTYLIGRVDGNDIILPSSNVSRQHARMFIRDSKCFIEDLGSSNGVIVDGQRIQGQRDLGSAAQIRIGDYYLYLEFNNEEDDKQDVVSTHIVSQDENAYKLVRVGDSFAGEVFPLTERRNTVGRTEDNTIFLNDPSASRRHANIDCDGMVYTLADLGSSNGSSVGAKRISGPTILRERDRVSFGNVDFIFVPSGENVDVSKYAGPAAPMPKTGGSGRSSGGGGIGIGVIIVGLLIVMLLFLTLAIAAAAGWWLYSSSQVEEVPPIATELSPEQKADSLVNDGRALMSQQKWTDAIAKFDEALTAKPDSEDAKKLKAQAVKEQDAQEKFEAGLKLKGKAQYDDALKKLESVPDGTSAHDTAAKELDEVRQILANQYKKAAREAMDKNEYGTAQEAFVKAFELICARGKTDQKAALKEIRDQITAAEDKMQRQRRRYPDFKPYEVAPQCR